MERRSSPLVHGTFGTIVTTIDETRRRFALPFLLTVAAGLPAHSAPAAPSIPVMLSKLVDTQTAVPDAPGRVFALLSVPSVSGGTTIFAWEDGGVRGPGGIYSYSGTKLSVIEDWPLSFCPSSCNRRGNRGSIGSGSIAYRLSDGSNFNRFGSTDWDLRWRSNGSMQSLLTGSRVCDFGVTPPDCSGTEAYDPFVSGTNLAFRLNNFDQPSLSGIYTSVEGVPVPLVTTGNAVPNSSARFASFGNPSMDGRSVAFRASDNGGQKGLYAGTRSRLFKFAGPTTPIPGQSGSFSDFGDPVIAGGKLAFRGLSPSQTVGIYTATTTTVLRVADTKSAIPAGTGNFVDFGNPAFNGKQAAFVGFGVNGSAGVYAGDGSSIIKIVRSADKLQGKTISELGLGPQGLSGNRLAFLAKFSDGTAAIYQAKIGWPVPFGTFHIQVSQGRPGSVVVSAQFSLGSESNGIDPARDSVRLTIGSFGISLPSGAFKPESAGQYRYRGVRNGIAIDARLDGTNHSVFRLLLAVRGSYIALPAGPVKTGLTIGDDQGTSIFTLGK